MHVVLPVDEVFQLFKLAVLNTRLSFQCQLFMSTKAVTMVVYSQKSFSRTQLCPLYRACVKPASPTGATKTNWTDIIFTTGLAMQIIICHHEKTASRSALCPRCGLCSSVQPWWIWSDIDQIPAAILKSTYADNMRV